MVDFSWLCNSGGSGSSMLFTSIFHLCSQSEVFYYFSILHYVFFLMTCMCFLISHKKIIILMDLLFDRVKHIMVTSFLLVCGAMTVTWICDTISESGFGMFFDISHMSHLIMIVIHLGFSAKWLDFVLIIKIICLFICEAKFIFLISCCPKEPKHRYAQVFVCDFYYLSSELLAIVIVLFPLNYYFL